MMAFHEEKIELEHSQDLDANIFVFEAKIVNTTIGVCLGVGPRVHLRLSPQDAIKLGLKLQEFGQDWMVKDYPGRSFP